MKRSPAPILLFTYNRPQHLERVIEALKKNELAKNSILYVFSDGPRSNTDRTQIDIVRQIIAQICGFRQVIPILREQNYGLAHNIIEGVTQVINQYEQVIVLEDDLETSPYFLQYMNHALNMYEDDPRIGNIHGHWFNLGKQPETFFLRFADSWGWGTWKRAWDLFEPNGAKLYNQLIQSKQMCDFDFKNSGYMRKILRKQIRGKNNSWAIRWNATIYLNNLLALTPKESLVRNIGCDGSGENFKNNLVDFSTTLYNQEILIEKELNPEENKYARQLMSKMYHYERSWITKGRRRIMQLFRYIFAKK